MRKLSLIAAASLLVPVAAQAKPLNELLLDKGVLGAADMKKDAGPARLTYDNGATLEFPSAGAKWKMNARLQSVYTYTDAEEGADSHSFDARNVRLDLGGSVLNDEFSFKLTNDFTKDTDSGTSGSKLQDAYIDWHACPESNVRAGQWMTPFGRQWMTENHNLQFVDRTAAAQAFNFGRQEGVGYYGTLADSYTHQLAVFNGNSSINGVSEGQNTGGFDNKLLVVYNGAFDVLGSYDRGYEGDPTMSEGSAGFGFSGFYSQDNISATGESAFSTGADQYGAAVDFGYRGGGMSFQVEGLYRGFSFDDVSFGGDDSADFFATYVQGGIMVAENMELAARFGWIDLDEDVSRVLAASANSAVVTDGYEVNASLNYYLNGHNLKVMTGPTWIIADNEGQDDVTDFRYQVGLFGYF